MTTAISERTRREYQRRITHVIDFMTRNLEKKILVSDLAALSCFLFSITGNPVVTIPIGFSKEKLPIGIQVIGKRYSDIKLLYMAESIADSLRFQIPWPLRD